MTLHLLRRLFGIGCRASGAPLGRPVTDTFGQAFETGSPRPLPAAAVWRLLLIDHTPLGPSAPQRGVVISGEVGCHVGSSTMSVSPVPPGGYPVTRAASSTSSSSARSSAPPSGIVDVDVSIADPDWDWSTPPWIM